MADNFTIDDIQKIRAMTGVGLTDAKQALQESGNFEAALAAMKTKGFKKISQRDERSTQAGKIFSYVHDGRIGVLLELACETDFVAKNEGFLNLGKDLVLQIAATGAVCLSEEDFEAIESDLAIEQACLLAQNFIKDPKQCVRDLLQTQSAQLGEKIVIVRFVRFLLGSSEMQLVLNKSQGKV